MYIKGDNLFTDYNEMTDQINVLLLTKVHGHCTHRHTLLIQLEKKLHQTYCIHTVKLEQTIMVGKNKVAPL